MPGTALRIYEGGQNSASACQASLWQLYHDFEGQIRRRADELPEGSWQGVVIDIRGQNVPEDVLQRIPQNIADRTENIVPPEDVWFMISDNEYWSPFVQPSGG